MFTSLLLFASLTSTTQTGKLELTNVRAHQGVWGGVRTDNKASVGEALHFSFDVIGLQPDELRRLRYRTTLEVFDSKGKAIYQPGPVESVLVDLFGMGQARQSVHVLTGLDQPPDTYKIKVTVQDAQSRKEASFTREVMLQAVDFSLIRCQITADREGQIGSPGLGVVGQTLYLNALAVGFKRDLQKEDKGFVTIELAVVDEKDKPLSLKPLVADAKDIPADVTFVPLRFEIPLQKAGSFKITVKATDQVSKKTATLTVPLQIVDAK